MERLTNTAWRNFDPWECCGQDNFCTRGCHEKGGCNNGCIVPKLYGRLAAYEDFMDRWHLKSIEDAERIFRRVNDLGGTDLMAQYRELGSINHLRDLLQAEKSGQLVVLPSKTVWELTMDAGPDCDMKCPVDAFDEALGCDLCSKAKQFAYERPCTQELLKELGKTVFLTREEAEAALAGKGGDG